ncbi:rho GTPase-activating protein 45-like [Petromyzon marinus]|uniref:rho GTPase-activating protein 45-like n=1 Tax=Petromyzon marinus TaxID=7757 RepID=UPI003F714E4C
MAGVGKLFSRRKKGATTDDAASASAAAVSIAVSQDALPVWSDASPPWRAYSPRRSPASLRHHQHQPQPLQRHSARSHSSVRSAMSCGAGSSPNAAGIRHVASTASLRAGTGGGGGGGGGAAVHARSPSATSLGSVFEAEGHGASVDPGDVSRLTADVRLFTDALGKLRDVFSNPALAPSGLLKATPDLCLSCVSLTDGGGEEGRRQAGHARLGELLLALKRTLARHPALSLREILTATGALITRVKGYPYERCIGADEQKQGMMQSVDSLALAFSNSVTEFLMGDSEGAWSSLRQQQHSRSLENLSGEKEEEEECRGAEGRDAKEDPAFAGLDSEDLDERLHSCDGGIDAALAYAKALSKYISGLAAYVERRLAVDVDYSKDLMKLAQCPMPAFTHEPPMPLQGVYASLMEQDWETAHAAAHTAAQLQADKCVLPLRSWREEHERKRKELKELWQKGQRRLTEAECSLKKARQLYSQRREELERARGSAARAEEGLAAVTASPADGGAGTVHSGSSRTLERKRKTEEEALRKAEEADAVYRASAKELRLRRQEVQAVKTVVLTQVRELARRADLALKTVTAAYFELLGTQAAALPARYRALHEGTDAYVAGAQYAAFARRLAEGARSSPATRERKLGREDSGSSEQCSVASPPPPRGDSKGSLKLNGKGEASRGRSWLVGGVSDTDSGSGSSESRSLDSPSASPGDFIRKLPRTPSTGTMSSVDDLDDTDPCSPADGDGPAMGAASSGAGGPEGVCSSPPSSSSSSSSSFTKAVLSEAARSHRLRKLRAPSRCRACDTLIYFQGAECQECLLACHKKCLESLAVRCSRECRAAPPSPLASPATAAAAAATLHRDETSGVPEPVRLCVSEIERRAMTLKGIYRVNGVKSRVERLCQAMEGARPGAPPDLQQASPHDVSNVLKLYLRQLDQSCRSPSSRPTCTTASSGLARDGPASPGPLAPDGSPGHDSPPPPPSPLSASPPALLSDGGGGIAGQLKALLVCLPEPNRSTLEYIVAHLHRVSRCEKENKMSAGNLGIVFGPTLMRSRPAPSVAAAAAAASPPSWGGAPCSGPLSSLADYPSQARVVQLLISHWPSLAPSPVPAPSPASSPAPGADDADTAAEVQGEGAASTAPAFPLDAASPAAAAAAAAASPSASPSSAGAGSPDAFPRRGGAGGAAGGSVEEPVPAPLAAAVQPALRQTPTVAPSPRPGAGAGGGCVAVVRREVGGGAGAGGGGGTEEPFAPVRVVQVKLSRINLADARHNRGGVAGAAPAEQRTTGGTAATAEEPRHEPRPPCARPDAAGGAASPVPSGTFRSTLVRCPPTADLASVPRGRPCELTVSRPCGGGDAGAAPSLAVGAGAGEAAREPAGGRRPRGAARAVPRGLHSTTGPRDFDVDGRADFV